VEDDYIPLTDEGFYHAVPGYMMVKGCSMRGLALCGIWRSILGGGRL
jgi:hypothetical protein